MVTCSKCQNPSPAEAIFCGFCGAEIAQAAEAEPAPRSTIFGYKVDVESLVDSAAKRDAAETTESAATEPGGAVESFETVRDSELPEAVKVAVADIREEKAQRREAAEGTAEPAFTGPEFSTAPDDRARMVGGLFLGAKLGDLPVGELYQARGPDPDPALELILLDRRMFASSLDSQRCLRELKMLEGAESPHILRTTGQGETSAGQIYLAYECFAAESLRDRVRQAPLSLVDAQRIVGQLGQALAAAQKVGVIHRDLAPHNVFMRADGSVVVAGFCYAPPLGPRSYGTGEFVSPEQIQGRPVDQRTNIYNLGAILYYALSGIPPYTDDNIESLLDKHRNAAIPKLSATRPDLKLPPKVDLLISKAMGKSSSARHLTLRQFLRELEAVSEQTQAHEAAAATKPRTFETPVHGVTALTGGGQPPLSGEVDGLPREAEEIGTESRPISLLDAKRPPVKSPPQAVAPEAESAAPEPAAPAQSQRQANAKDGKSGFRETMWFFKGEVESSLSGEERKEAPVVEETPDELAEKYKDDGSLADAGADKFSLKTGSTQMMDQVEVPEGRVPGKRLNTQQVFADIDRNRRYKVWLSVGGVLALAGAAAALWYFVF
jgi:serine/threonine protein kinase